MYVQIWVTPNSGELQVKKQRAQGRLSSVLAQMGKIACILLPFQKGQLTNVKCIEKHKVWSKRRNKTQMFYIKSGRIMTASCGNWREDIRIRVLRSFFHFVSSAASSSSLQAQVSSPFAIDSSLVIIFVTSMDLFMRLQLAVRSICGGKKTLTPRPKCASACLPSNGLSEHCFFLISQIEMSRPDVIGGWVLESPGKNFQDFCSSAIPEDQIIDTRFLMYTW